MSTLGIQPVGIFSVHLKNIKSLEYTPNFVIRLIASGIFGALLGIGVSFTVNCALVEISMSPFFSMYFGILFISVGGVIIWRVQNQLVNPSTQNEKSRKIKLMLTGATVMFSGFLCFLLERNWFMGISSFIKIPLYSILGLSVAFALTFSVVDSVNWIAGLLQSKVSRSIIDSTQQVHFVLIITGIMGSIFGFIFGLLDIEDEMKYHVKLALMHEEHLCYPIGVVLGLIGGMGNEYLRHQDDEYAVLQHTQFDEEL